MTATLPQYDPQEPGQYPLVAVARWAVPRVQADTLAGLPPPGLGPVAAVLKHVPHIVLIGAQGEVLRIDAPRIATTRAAVSNQNPSRNRAVMQHPGNAMGNRRPSVPRAQAVVRPAADVRPGPAPASRWQPINALPEPLLERAKIAGTRAVLALTGDGERPRHAEDAAAADARAFCPWGPRTRTRAVLAIA